MSDVLDEVKVYFMMCFGNEALWLMDVFEKCLEGWDYVCGDNLIIVDIVLYFWVYCRINILRYV